ncbi:hypothetical protein I6E29_05475 [Arcanobacterium haemolyticum]|nr:hypothetical protein [Arcanobacterium haemolyticum]
MRGKFSLREIIYIVISIPLGILAVYFVHGHMSMNISPFYHKFMWVVFLIPGACILVLDFLVAKMYRKIFPGEEVPATSEDFPNDEETGESDSSQLSDAAPRATSTACKTPQTDEDRVSGVSSRRNDPQSGGVDPARHAGNWRDSPLYRVLIGILGAFVAVLDFFHKRRKPRIDVTRYDVDNRSMRAIIPAPFNQLAYPPGSYLLGWSDNGRITCLPWPQNGYLTPDPHLENMGVLTCAVRVRGHWLLSTWLPAYMKNGEEKWLVWPIVDRNGPSSLLSADDQHALGFDVWDGEGDPSSYVEIPAGDIEAARLRLWVGPVWQGHSRNVDVDPAAPFGEMDRIASWITILGAGGKSSVTSDRRQWKGGASWLEKGPDTLGGPGKSFGYIEPDETTLSNFPPQANVYFFDEARGGRLAVASTAWAQANQIVGACLCLAVYVEGHWVIADKPGENTYRVFPWEIVDGTARVISNHDLYRELWKLNISYYGRDNAVYGAIAPDTAEAVKPVVVGVSKHCADVKSSDGTIEGIDYRSLAEAVRLVTM